MNFQACFLEMRGDIPFLSQDSEVNRLEEAGNALSGKEHLLLKV